MKGQLTFDGTQRHDLLYESFADDLRRASCKCGWTWEGRSKTVWLHAACEHWLATREPETFAPRRIETVNGP